ncbi:MAG TPA: PEP-CTERM sorting domain-containing protein [Bryobacteraceae bacterium]|jgi:hypothetical protein|nr:PEP-CTERM sorting domain-containing protein [Bryobacteraceae bacterium]
MKFNRNYLTAVTLSGVITLAGLAISGDARADVLTDSVNASYAADNGAYWGDYDVGWVYSPSTSYQLSGIDTEFSIPNLTSVQNRTVTVVVYNGLPSSGGTFLGSFQFDSATAEGVLAGGSFSMPISLTAGQQYFVGFMNVGPMSTTPNVDDLGVNFTADPSGVVLSNLYFDSSIYGNSGFGSCSNTTDFACVEAATGGNSVLGEPILEFFAPNPVTPPSAPEPTSVALLGSGLVGLGVWARLRHRS